MVGIAQLVRASGCGPEGRGFKSHYSPQYVLLAPWCNWLTHHPFKVESTGSIPVGVTKPQRVSLGLFVFKCFSHKLLNKIVIYENERNT